MLGIDGVESPTRESLELRALHVRATREVATLLGKLRHLRDSAPEVRAIKAIEDEADRVARAARAGLFNDDRIDPGIVIRWKGIYEALEDAVDACDTAANRIGNILVKNAEAGRRRGGVAANRHETGTERHRAVAVCGPGGR